MQCLLQIACTRQTSRFGCRLGMGTCTRRIRCHIKMRYVSINQKGSSTHTTPHRTTPTKQGRGEAGGWGVSATEKVGGMPGTARTECSPLVRLEFCRHLCLPTGIQRRTALRPSNAMTSSEDHASAESESRRLLHREGTDEAPPQCPRADSR